LIDLTWNVPHNKCSIVWTFGWLGLVGF